MKKNCENCRYWASWPKQITAGQIFGDCRRHAPQVFPSNGKFASKFPSTPSECYCGSYKPAGEKEEAN